MMMKMQLLVLPRALPSLPSSSSPQHQKKKICELSRSPQSFRHAPSSAPLLQLHHHQQQQQHRRHLLASSLHLALLGFAFVGSANSAPDTAITPPKNQLIEQLLERSRANKEKYDKQRLDNYYERNFKDYFEFVEGTIRNKTDLTETEKGILLWLERNRNKNK